MLLVSVELLPGVGTERYMLLGQTGITNVGGGTGYGSYLIELRNGPDKPPCTALLTDYPNAMGDVWDLVSRSIVLAITGREELPPRPLLSPGPDGSQH